MRGHPPLYRSTPRRELRQPDSSVVVEVSVASLCWPVAGGPVASVARPCCLLILDANAKAALIPRGRSLNPPIFRMQPFYHISSSGTIRKLASSSDDYNSLD